MISRSPNNTKPTKMTDILPVFKTHCSFGKSILTESMPPKELKEGEVNYKEGGKKSILQIARENNLKEMVVIEDSMVGFYDLHANAKAEGVKLMFGTTFKMGDPENKNSAKVVLLGHNDEGHDYLMKKFSDCNINDGGYLNIKDVDCEHVEIVIPFYDSFIDYNMLHEDPIVPEMGNNKPIFLLEDKELPFDGILRNRTKEYCEANGFETLEAHTILYEKNEDAKALQVYKMSCFRTFNGKKASIGNPNLKFFGSDKFSWEEYARRTT